MTGLCLPPKKISIWFEASSSCLVQSHCFLYSLLDLLVLLIFSLGFVGARSDTSLFIYHRGSDTVYLLLYVDDIVLTASSDVLLHQIIQSLQQEFSMKDLGSLHHFLGVSVTRRPDGLFLSQRQYIQDILQHAGMSDCKPCTIPVDTSAKLSLEGDPVADATRYRGLAGALQYLTFHPSCLCCSAGLLVYA